MKFKKFRTLVLAACIAAAAAGLSGCGENEASVGDDGSKEVTLKWIFGGPGEQKDSKEVWASFNEKLPEYLPNTQVEFECISTTDFAEKWKLISASQENIDIVWNGWMIPYITEVQKGSYMPLDDLIKEYAPEIYNEIPENILDKSRVNGELYSIPCLQQMVSYVSTMGFPVEIYEKYKDKINPEELQQFFGSHQTMDKECWDKIEEYIVMLKEGGDLKEGVYGFADHVEKGYEWILNPYKINIYTDDYTPINIYRTPEYETFVNVISDWYNKGYIRKDVLTSDNLSDALYEIKGAGNYLIGQGYMPTKSEIEAKKAAGSQAYVQIPFDTSHYIPYAAAATNTAISINSKNPERSMKLLELMNTAKGKDIYNLLVYGIEGKHYTKVNDMEIQPIGYSSQPTSDSPYGQYKWAVGNTYNAYEVYMEDKSVTLKNDFIKSVNENAGDSKLKGFTLNTDNIKTELAQVNAVIGEYKSTLNSGAAPDQAALYKEFIDKLVKAGDDKITAEIKSQLDAWRAQQ
ncbi:MAG: ABC transporter substrate-binding protein [Clostridia bacterium]|nr:ABC transporter substrate-binding protein [Clostridia bacterium]